MLPPPRRHCSRSRPRPPRAAPPTPPLAYPSCRATSLWGAPRMHASLHACKPSCRATSLWGAPRMHRGMRACMQAKGRRSGRPCSRSPWSRSARLHSACMQARLHSACMRARSGYSARSCMQAPLPTRGPCRARPAPSASWVRHAKRRAYRRANRRANRRAPPPAPPPARPAPATAWRTSTRWLPRDRTSSSAEIRSWSRSIAGCTATSHRTGWPT